MRKIEEKYATEVAVIGVHSAKFPNEKARDNLYKAVQRNELQHPVVNDADFHVWRAYACRAWPTMMFIDPEGKVIGKHEGEISYESLDKLMGDMVTEFDARGLLKVTLAPLRLAMYIRGNKMTANRPTNVRVWFDYT